MRVVTIVLYLPRSLCVCHCVDGVVGVCCDVKGVAYAVTVYVGVVISVGVAGMVNVVGVDNVYVINIEVVVLSYTTA